MAGELAKLFVTLGLDDKEFQKTLKSVQANLSQAGKMMTGIGAAITAPLALSVKQFAEAGDEIQKMALKTGFATETLSELKYAAEQSGTSLETLQSGIRSMSNLIVDAGKGMKSAQESLSTLGISLQDLEGLSPEEQFNKLAAAIANVQDDTMKMALAQDVFGKAGMDLLPMLSGGAEGLAQMRKEAQNLGLVFSQDAADQAANFGDALADLKGSMQGIMNVIAENLIPAITPLIEKVKEVAVAIGDWMKEHPELAKTITVVVAAIGGIMVVLGPILMALPMISSGLTLMMGPVGGIILGITALIAVGTLLIMNWDKIKAALSSVWDWMKDTFKGVVNFLINIFEGYINFYIRGINSLIGALNKIQFNVPDWVPAIGGKSLGINIPLVPEISLPRLAAGGIITSPMVGMVGEAGPEAIIPLNKIGGVGQTVVVNVAGSVLSERDLIDVIREALLRTQNNNASLGFA